MSPKQQTRSDRWATSLADFVTRRPWLVIGLTLALVAAAAGGARFLEFSNNYRVFFSPDNPDLVAFENFQQTYTKNDNILFVLQPAEGGVFTPDVTDAWPSYGRRDLRWQTCARSSACGRKWPKIRTSAAV